MCVYDVTAINCNIDQCREYLGDNYFLDELVRALDLEELRSCVEFIARNHDIELDCEM